MIHIILVFLEQRNGVIKKSSLEAVKFADTVSQFTSADIDAVVIGNEVDNSQLTDIKGLKKGKGGSFV